MASRPLTDEGLSRVLSAHDEEELISGGRTWPCPCGLVLGCVNQFAFNEDDPMVAMRTNVPLSRRFDKGYRPSMTHEELLELLEQRTK